MHDKPEGHLAFIKLLLRAFHRPFPFTFLFLSHALHSRVESVDYPTVSIQYRCIGPGSLHCMSLYHTVSC